MKTKHNIDFSHVFSMGPVMIRDHIDANVGIEPTTYRDVLVSREAWTPGVTDFDYAPFALEGGVAQKNIAELFQTTKQNIGQHLKNIFAEEEPEESSAVKRFFTTVANGKKVHHLFGEELNTIIEALNEALAA